MIDGLEELLADARIWRGRSSGAARGLPTGFAALDRCLPGGGWPRKALIEIGLSRHGVGELSLLMPALAALSRQAVRTKRWILWAAPPYVPYAPALSRHGVDLDCLLLIHPGPKPPTSQAAGADRPACAEVAWAVEQALRSGASVAVLAWLDTVGDGVLRRLQLAAEEHDCWTVLFRPLAALRQRSPAKLRIGLTRSAALMRVGIVKCRGMRPKTVELDLADGDVTASDWADVDRGRPLPRGS